MITFSKQPFQVVEDNFHLIKEHWDEVVRDERPLEPFWDVYREIEKIGNLVCFCVYRNDEVIGYAVFVIQPDVHSRNVKIASNNTVFLKKEHRKNGVGRAFLEYCDEELEKIDVQRIAWHMTPVVDFSGALKSMNYRHFATIYVRDIGGQNV
jgi:GNAT superfamily N-acetyltransferase